MAEQIPTCYRHADRRAGVICQRCDRPICPSCMVTASVGFHCPECARVGRQKVLTARSLATRPIVTQVLIAVNVGIFLIGLGQGGGELMSASDELNRDFSLFGPAVDRLNEWYRIFTSGFLHVGLIHLGFNMAALWFIGSQLEPAYGRLRFCVLYVVSMVAGSFGVLILDPNVPTVGASGAIFGLMGAAVASQRAAGVNIWDSGVGTLVALNLLITFTFRGISIGGHIGGLVGGLVVGWLFFDLGPRLRDSWVPIALAVAFGCLCFAGGIWAAAR